MGQFQHFSPMTAYYLRQLLEKKHHQLNWSDSNSNTSITLDNILKHLETKGSGAARKLGLLDRFVFLHQSFASAYPDDSIQVQNIEIKIYECLDLKWVAFR